MAKTGELKNSPRAIRSQSSIKALGIVVFFGKKYDKALYLLDYWFPVYLNEKYGCAVSL